ncbi:MAG TPA: TlpA disulfide reductase family protein [Pyrinomonadaceae bacterium]|nr:TlpA disulfide reductase family protein [Pyrinomonadaceae bacterium]
MTKLTLSAVALCAALACAAGLAPACAQQGAAPAPKTQAGAAKTKNDGAKSSNVAPPKITEVDEDGLRSLLGPGAERPRPLLVNFWATWCTPCREEFPDLVKIREQYAADKLDFVIVSLDDPSDIGKAVPEFLAEVRATAFPAYLLHAADDNNAINLVDPTWSGELPATFLYDRAGALVFKHKGRVKVPELRAALDEALKEKPQAAGAQK